MTEFRLFVVRNLQRTNLRSSSFHPPLASTVNLLQERERETYTQRNGCLLQETYNNIQKEKEKARKQEPLSINPRFNCSFLFLIHFLIHSFILKKANKKYATKTTQQIRNYDHINVSSTNVVETAIAGSALLLAALVGVNNEDDNEWFYGGETHYDDEKQQQQQHRNRHGTPNQSSVGFIIASLF